MRKIMSYIVVPALILMLFLLCFGEAVWAEEELEESELYAKSAVLMDASSGRVLYEKNGYEPLPMASTTKIMTCIIALERGNSDDLVTISKLAAAQPKVRLGVKEGEQYRLEDLLYSLMLESHNDSAVAIAEHIGGSVEDFAKLMNQKAKSIGCQNTYYITPNGLDAVVTTTEGGGVAKVQEHRTTAADLARIMAYCVHDSDMAEHFIQLTQTKQYSFGNRSCTNHNAFLHMMDGVLSGKTGYTSKAGYCYVCALEDEDRIFTVALLACGWPNHKTYKWEDSRLLLQYGTDHYRYCAFDDLPAAEMELEPALVQNGQTERIGEKAYVSLHHEVVHGSKQTEGILLRDDEEIEMIYAIPSTLKAPVSGGSQVGSIKYLAGGTVWRTETITTAESVAQIDYTWCLAKIVAIFLT